MTAFEIIIRTLGVLLSALDELHRETPLTDEQHAELAYQRARLAKFGKPSE